MGSIFSVIGVGLWVLFGLNIYTDYPLFAHSQIMLGGFLFSFVSGFLMTALPKMTATFPAQKSEKIVVIGLLILQVFSAFLDKELFSTGLMIILFFSILVFFIRRRLKSLTFSNTSAVAVFIPLALVSGLVGSCCLFFSRLGYVQWLTLGKLLFYEAFVLNLIIGLGSRLIPVLSKKNNALSPMESQQISNFELYLEAVIFNLTYFTEFIGWVSLSSFFRAIILLYIIVRNFKTFHPMIEFTKLGRMINAASLFFPLTYFLISILPEYRVHLVHILYISGFATLTYLISVRVTLAHSSLDLEQEKKSPSIYLFSIGFILAMTIRVLAPFLFSSYIFLSYFLAAFLFIFSVFIWFFFLKKGFIFEKSSNSSL